MSKESKFVLQLFNSLTGYEKVSLLFLVLFTVQGRGVTLLIAQSGEKSTETHWESSQGQVSYLSFSGESELLHADVVSWQLATWETSKHAHERTSFIVLPLLSVSHCGSCAASSGSAVWSVFNWCVRSPISHFHNLKNRQEYFPSVFFQCNLRASLVLTIFI